MYVDLPAHVGPITKSIGAIIPGGAGRPKRTRPARRIRPGAGARTLLPWAPGTAASASRKPAAHESTSCSMICLRIAFIRRVGLLGVGR